MKSRVGRNILLWVLPAGAAVLSGIVLAVGLVSAFSGRPGEPAAELAPAAAPAPALPPSGTLAVVALGDSLTRGTGDDGHGGYPARIARALEKEGRAVSLTNLGVDGLETSGLVDTLERPEVRALVSRADLVLVSISGNDLTHSLGEATPEGLPAGVLEKARAGVEKALRTIRSLNGHAAIRLVGIYDPAPAAGAIPARRFVARWNEALEETALGVPGAVFVPVADLFDARPDLVGSDRFHPGPAGYDEISARIAATLPPPPGDNRRDEPRDVGVDLGATLAKAVAVPADSPLESFETFVAPAADDAPPRRLPRAPLAPRILAATGGGRDRAGRPPRAGTRASSGRRRVRGVGRAASSPPDGARRPLPADPHLLVSLGTGTSILRVDGTATVRARRRDGPRAAGRSAASAASSSATDEPRQPRRPRGHAATGGASTSSSATSTARAASPSCPT